MSKDEKQRGPRVGEMFVVSPREGGRPLKTSGGKPSTPTPANQPDTRKMIGANGKPLGDNAPWPPKGQAAPSMDPRAAE